MLLAFIVWKANNLKEGPFTWRQARQAPLIQIQAGNFMMYSLKTSWQHYKAQVFRQACMARIAQILLTLNTFPPSGNPSSETWYLEIRWARNHLMHMGHRSQSASRLLFFLSQLLLQIYCYVFKLIIIKYINSFFL